MGTSTDRADLQSDWHTEISLGDRQVDQAFGLKSPDPFPPQRVWSGHETSPPHVLATTE